MRRALLLLIIALLPLRAWVGDAMALAEVPGTAALHGTAAASAMPPCHAHAASHDGAHATADAAHVATTTPGQPHAPNDAPDAADPHAGCSHCDICHSGVLCAARWPGAAMPAPRARPASVDTDFASAPLRGAFKPPIA